MKYDEPHLLLEWLDGSEWGDQDFLGWTWHEFGYGGYVGSTGTCFGEDFNAACADAMGYIVSTGMFDMPLVVVPHE